MIILKKLTDAIPAYLIYMLAFFLPLIFTPFTTEFYETAKLALLVIVVLLLIFFWSLKVFTEGKISLVKTPLDLSLVIYLAVALISTILSPSSNTALFGILPKVHGSFIFISATILLYFMVSGVVRTKDIKVIPQIMIFSGLILSIISLLSYFKIYLPWDPASFQNFSLAGSSTGAATYLSLLLPISLSLFFLNKDLKNLNLSAILSLASTLIFAVTILLTGNPGVWIAAFLAIVLTIYIQKPAKEQFALLGGICTVVLIIATLSFTPTLKDKTPLGGFSTSFQKDIQLPFNFSWKISAGAFRDSPVLGTGPGTYLYNFTKYKPLEINKTDLWDKRVSSANNHYLQTLAELGGVGLILLLSVAAAFTFTAFKNHDREGLGLSGVSFFILMAFSPMSVLTETAGFLILAVFMGSLAGNRKEVKLMEVRLGSEEGIHPLLPVMIFIPVLALILASVYFAGKLILGEYYHRQALNAAALNKALDSYNFLIKAERSNPQADLYRVDLAQTNFALANGIASQKGPSEASPGGTLTDDDRRNIQTLLQQSIAEGRAATALAPGSARNWEVLAQIYRQISGVAQNGTQFALNAYGRAIQADPLNPILRLAVGGVYYSSKNYDLAVRFFDDAVALKPDYTNGLYNLSIALRDKGNTADAIRVAERLVAALQADTESGSYKTATELLLKLKEQASSQQPQSEIPPSALENKELPKVLDEEDLGTPEKISTPPAVSR